MLHSGFIYKTHNKPYFTHKLQLANTWSGDLSCVLNFAPSGCSTLGESLNIFGTQYPKTTALEIMSFSKNFLSLICYFLGLLNDYLVFSLKCPLFYEVFPHLRIQDYALSTRYLIPISIRIYYTFFYSYIVCFYE